jgi:hypothetical protein
MYNSEYAIQSSRPNWDELFVNASSVSRHMKGGTAIRQEELCIGVEEEVPLPQSL